MFCITSLQFWLHDELLYAVVRVINTERNHGEQFWRKGVVLLTVYNMQR